ncbi:unnamed protein product [Spirodela intermedia]|uniref:HMA domain-containing protein n=1 Tax=Spirodela intermedia TaxID=51605 RepID=A0A7I8IIR0_SPIIN|nr:unnamed protein product [Spirodela intermedia]CAA6656844.1 unnamed protein product [Spirodela intermedia]
MKGMSLSCTVPGSEEEWAGVDSREPVDGRGRPLNSQPPSPSKQKTRFQKSRRSYQRQSDSVNPLASTRYLLDGDESFLESFLDLDALPVWSRIDSARFHSVTGDDSPSLKPSYSSASSSRNFLVHIQGITATITIISWFASSCAAGCRLEGFSPLQGCAGKVRRHIARMEGVRSYNIEFDAKRVTVVGDVTPLGVLSSVSKIKKAEFWAPA